MNQLEQTLFVLLGLAASMNVFAQNGISGGGEVECEARFHDIRKTLYSWIDEAKFQGLELPNGWTIERYRSAMKPFMLDQAVAISCLKPTEKNPEPVQVNGVPKMCRNSKGGSLDKPLIECNLDRFLAAKGDVAFKTIHHEFANLAGLEKYGNEVSDYSVSDQIALYTIEVTVTKLGLQKKSASPCLRYDEIYKSYGEKNEYMYFDVEVSDGTTVSNAFWYSVMHNTYLLPKSSKRNWPDDYLIQDGCRSINHSGKIQKIVEYSLSSLKFEDGSEVELRPDGTLRARYMMGYTTGVSCPQSIDDGGARFVQESHDVWFQVLSALNGTTLNEAPMTRRFLEKVVVVSTNRSPTDEQRRKVCAERGKSIPEELDLSAWRAAGGR